MNLCIFVCLFAVRPKTKFQFCYIFVEINQIHPKQQPLVRLTQNNCPRRNFFFLMKHWFWLSWKKKKRSINRIGQQKCKWNSRKWILREMERERWKIARSESSSSSDNIINLMDGHYCTGRFIHSFIHSSRWFEMIEW